LYWAQYNSFFPFKTECSSAARQSARDKGGIQLTGDPRFRFVDLGFADGTAGSLLFFGH
jgi:hypothetical protein